MRLTTKLSIIFLAVCLVSATIVSAQQPTPEEQAEMMAKMQELAKPGPEHQELAKLEGKWTYTTKLWMTPKAESPMVTEGTSNNKMIIGGRFLECKYESMMMGQKFEGVSIMGFDRRNGVFTSVGFDNTGTYWVSASGAKNEDTGEIVMKGTDYDAIGDFTQEYKFIMNVKDEDNYSFDVIFTDPVMSQGTGNFKMVELEYTRVNEKK